MDEKGEQKEGVKSKCVASCIQICQLKKKLPNYLVSGDRNQPTIKMLHLFYVCFFFFIFFPLALVSHCESNDFICFYNTDVTVD